jgi:hypothetical protein
MFKKSFNCLFLLSSGFLIMLTPKCSYLPFVKTKLDDNVDKVYQRVIDEDQDPIDEELLGDLEEEERMFLLDE